MNTNTGIAILLVVCSIMLLIECKNIARCLVSIWNTGMVQKTVFILYVVILAIIVFVVCLLWGFIKYFINESTRMKADTQLEILVSSMTPKRAVKIKKTPLAHNHAAYVKPIKKAKKRINVSHGLRSLSIGLRIASMLPRIKF